MLSKLEAKKIKRFLEEFSWLMETYSNIDLKKASSLIDESLGETSKARKAVGVYESANPNINFLTGVLPSLFLDTSLFKTNDEIAEFANIVLKIDIPSPHKKSKHEIIGHIVCKTNKLNEKGLDKLVRALSLLVNDETRKKILVKKKKDGTFGWNDIIQSLIKD